MMEMLELMLYAVLFLLIAPFTVYLFARSLTGGMMDGFLKSLTDHAKIDKEESHGKEE